MNKLSKFNKKKKKKKEGHLYISIDNTWEELRTAFRHSTVLKTRKHFRDA